VHQDSKAQQKREMGGMEKKAINQASVSLFDECNIERDAACYAKERMQRLG
jgi:hypothetical protein